MRTSPVAPLAQPVSLQIAHPSGVSLLAAVVAAAVAAALSAVVVSSYSYDVCECA